MHVEDKEDGPDKAFEGTSSYDAGTTEDLGWRCMQCGFCSHDKIVACPTRWLQEIAEAF